MQSVTPAIRRARRSWRAAAAVVLAGTALTACQTLEPASPVAEVVAPSIPTDYRLRHPIKLREGTRAVELFIGSHRTDLTPSQRAQVKFFGQGWNANATGGVAIRVPTATPNEEAARRAVPEIRSILLAAGVPADGIVVTPAAAVPAEPARPGRARISEDRRERRAVRPLAERPGPGGGPRLHDERPVLQLRLLRAA